jgi:hypothetical protein
MQPVLSCKDTHGDTIHLVIPKIREVFKAMGNVVIVFDNGDRRTVETNDANSLIEEILTALRTFYSGK